MIVSNTGGEYNILVNLLNSHFSIFFPLILTNDCTKYW